VTNPSKQKGDRGERAVVAWLSTFRGFLAERVKAGRAIDGGDIVWPDSPWLLDVKDQRRWMVPAWFAEVEDEATQQDLQPLLILKRPGQTDPGRWLAIVRLEDLEL